MDLRPASSIPTLDPVTSSYEQAMMFVEDFKNARAAKGYERMDWTACYTKGMESKNLIIKVQKFFAVNIISTKSNKKNGSK